MSTVGLVLVAAGSGVRLGRGIPKAFVEIDGVSLLARALGVAHELGPDSIGIAGPPSHLDEVRDVVADEGLTAHVVAGGATRTDSVRNALAALPDVDIVLVHDVARAGTPLDVFRRVIDAVAETSDGIIPVLPVVDTIVVADDGVVVDNTERSRLQRVQTPQGFPAERFANAFATAIGDFTDDASIWRAAGGTVRTVDGDERAHKITVESDIASAATTARVGLGTDTHAFGDTTPLWLGCVEWPGETALAGHSDGDAVAHAICDALLAGAGLGDIGTVFGTDDPRYSGARGEVFLRGALEKLADAGSVPRSVSVQIVGNRPKIGPRRVELERVLSDILGVPVSVSATTTDGLGFTGEGKGITAIAIAHVSAR
jgi:2-C-methyl-D-erythritol 4-phosphate cytidylyltransferase/2-C-methyl-D-erythritol 2,4-cyclodiphosphate synthase